MKAAGAGISKALEMSLPPLDFLFRLFLENLPTYLLPPQKLLIKTTMDLEDNANHLQD